MGHSGDVDASSLLFPRGFDKGGCARDTSRMGAPEVATPAHRADGAPPLLLAGLAAFVAVLAYLVVSSLRRREAPVFVPTATTRTRPASWTVGGDTLTLDSADPDAWRYASLAAGRALELPDTAGWELAARRFRVTVAGALADLGAVPWETARPGAATRWVTSRPGEQGNAADRWYRYGVVTHLLEPNGHVFALRTRAGRTWKLQVLGYYCPGVRAGCLTMRYAPLDPVGR
jgi:hypothetical protein